MTAEDRDQLSLFPENDTYAAFTAKFKPKKTTDDCMTPPNIYDAVAEWVCREYGVERERFIRPFWPHTDYLTYPYPEGCIVVDNPPFSIRAGIVAYYNAKGIRYFLFSPALTLLVRGQEGKCCHIATGVSITYDNGAEVPTSFVTNLECSAIRTAPELYLTIKRANQDNLRKQKKSAPKYQYPDAVLTAAMMQRYSHYGIEWKLSWDQCRMINGLDMQRKAGKSIFGGGLLLAERAAAERAAAERAAAERAAAERAAAERAAAERAAAERAAAEQWELSEREIRMQKEMDNGL